MKEKRIEEIKDYIARNKTVTIEALCEAFDVSRNTVHRDLNMLAKRGVVKKIYGGVVYEEAMETIPLETRSIRYQDQKMRIAKKAATLVNPGDSIFIDTGSTATCFYRALPKDLGLTIFTNNIDVLVHAVKGSGDTIIFTGGILFRKTYSVTGEDAINTLSHYNIGKAFMSATGISQEFGATNSTQGEYHVKTAAIRASREVIMLADSSKFGVVSLMTFCNLSDIHTVVTDQAPPKDFEKFFKEHNTRVLIA